MLQKIREKITGWVAGVILALLAFVFAVWGIDLGSGTSNKALVVNGEEVPVALVRRAIQNRLAQFQQAYGVEVPEAIQQQIRDDVIEGFVRNRLLVERTRQQAYRVSDEDLSRSVREMPVFQVGGQFSLESYRAMLANVGYTPTSFEAEQRQELQIAQLRDGILNSAFTTELELSQRIQLEKEQRQVGWIEVSLQPYLDQAAVSDDDIAARYEEQSDRYLNPETVDVEFVEVRLADLAAGIEVTEEKLRDFYDEEVSRDPLLYKTPEQRKTRHILINIGDDEEAARIRAQDLLERVRGGEDFATVAREASEDSGSASLGGDLDWIEPGTMDDPFEDALFSMEAGEIAGPVRTPYGFHVILLEEIRPGETRSFEQTREDMAQLLKEREAEDLYYSQAETLERLAFENPDSLDPAAEALGTTIERIDGMGRTGTDAFPGNSEFVTTAFSDEMLENRQNSNAIEAQEGHAVVMRIADYHEASAKPLEEVRGQIEATLKREFARERANELANEIEARLEAGDDPMAVAEDAAAQFHESVLVERSDTDVPGPVRDAAFTAQRPAGGFSVDRVTMIDGSVAVIKVTEVLPGDAATLDDTEIQIFSEDVKAETSGGELTAYVEQLRSDASVVVTAEQFE